MTSKQGLNFGDTIHKLRQDRGLTLRTLASRSGLSFGRIGEIERGLDAHSGKPLVPSYMTVLKLARALGVSDVELLRLAGYEPGDEPKHQEVELLEIFRGLSPDKRLALLAKAYEIEAANGE
jgi:transcriptional regulator with XRE-family HTH domain